MGTTGKGATDAGGIAEGGALPKAATLPAEGDGVCPAAVPSGGFDYASLPAEDADVARAAAAIIRNVLRNSITTVGDRLLKVKARLLGRGDFQRWVEMEVGISARSAENYMAAARWLDGKCATVAKLPPSVIYRLSARNAPVEAVRQIEAEAEAGALPSAATILARLDAARTAREAAESRTAEEQAWVEALRPVMPRLVFALGGKGCAALRAALGDRKSRETLVRLIDDVRASMGEIPIVTPPTGPREVGNLPIVDPPTGLRERVNLPIEAMKAALLAEDAARRAAVAKTEAPPPKLLTMRASDTRLEVRTPPAIRYAPAPSAPEGPPTPPPKAEEAGGDAGPKRAEDDPPPPPGGGQPVPEGNTQPEAERLIPESVLRRRPRWHQRRINSLLGGPDTIRPFERDGNLYDLARVEAIEAQFAERGEAPAEPPPKATRAIVVRVTTTTHRIPAPAYIRTADEAPEPPEDDPPPPTKQRFVGRPTEAAYALH